ncbi:MAG: flagellar motor switch protein FliN [Treponemataceae bacterium]|nr:flagellar motor switch protein FliN [Treponemataceae bacterium]
MSDGAISQDEIDALLSGVDMGGLGGSSGGLSSSASSTPAFDVPTLKNFINDQTATLKGSLDTMTGASFEVGSVTVENVQRDDVLKKVPEMVVSVVADYNTTLVGDHLFILAPEFAQKLTALINSEENPELSDMALSIAGEVVSQHAGSEVTSLCAGGRLAGLSFNPAESVHVPKAMVRFPAGSFALASYPISLDGNSYTLWEIFSGDVAGQITSALGGGSTSGADNSVGGLSAAEMQSMTSMGGLGGMGGGMSGMGMGAPMGGMNMGGGMPNMGMGGMGMGGGMPNMGMGGMNMGGGMPNMGMMGMGGGMPQQIPNVQQLQYPNLTPTQGGEGNGNIGLIMDVFMEMTVELGRTKKPIKEILGMGEGTIIELEKLAGEPVDILVNHKPIACGEVVVIDENFGVRVTKILSPMERVADLH